MERGVLAKQALDVPATAHEVAAAQVKVAGKNLELAKLGRGPSRFSWPELKSPRERRVSSGGRLSWRTRSSRAVAGTCSNG